MVLNVTSDIQQSDWTVVLKSDRLFRQPFVVMHPAAARGSRRGGEEAGSSSMRTRFFVEISQASTVLCIVWLAIKCYDVIYASYPPLGLLTCVTWAYLSCSFLVATNYMQEPTNKKLYATSQL